MLRVITQDTADVTAADGTANVESTIWDIKNPETVMRIFQGNHRLKLKIFDGSATPVRITKGTVKIVVQDPNANHTKTIYSGDLSYFSGDQISELETNRLGNTWGAFPFYHVLIKIKSATVVESSNSTFALECEEIQNVSFEESKANFPDFLLG